MFLIAFHQFSRDDLIVTFKPCAYASASLYRERKVRIIITLSLFMLLTQTALAGIVDRVRATPQETAMRIDRALDRADAQAQCAGLQNLRSRLSCWTSVIRSVGSDRFVRLRTNGPATISGTWREGDEIISAVLVELAQDVIVEFRRVEVDDVEQKRAPRYEVFHSQYGLLLSDGAWRNRQGRFSETNATSQGYGGDVIDGLFALGRIRKN
jgi:hypothetical protein